MDKIKTSKLAAFINTTPKAEEETFSRIRKQGELKLKYDAETSEEGYIDEDSKSKNTDSYAVGFDGELIAHTGDPVFEYLDDLRQNRAVNADAETEVIIVYIYDKDGESYAAEKNTASIQLGDFGGEGGGGNLSLNYTCSFNGNPIKGTATITDGKVVFTPSV